MHAEPDRMAIHAAAPAAHRVALGRLHLDHLGAEVGQQPGGEGRGDVVAELDDLQPGEGQASWACVMAPPIRRNRLPARKSRGGETLRQASRMHVQPRGAAASLSPSWRGLLPPAALRLARPADQLRGRGRHRFRPCSLRPPSGFAPQRFCGRVAPRQQEAAAHDRRRQHSPAPPGSARLGATARPRSPRRSPRPAAWPAPSPARPIAAAEPMPAFAVPMPEGRPR